MRRQSHSGKSDQRGAPISDVRDPAMLRSITAGDNRSYRERHNRVAGWEASVRAQISFVVLEPRVRKISMRRYVTRAQASVDVFHYGGQDFGVCDRFAG